MVIFMPRLIRCFSQGIAELSDMIIERLQAFRRRSNVLPKRMIIFRDGVSEVLFRRSYLYCPPDQPYKNRVNTTK